MGIISGENDEEIVIPFPQNKFGAYCKAVGATAVETMSFAQIKTIFLAMIEDFKKGALSLDEFSEIANLLWIRGLKSHMDKTHTDLGDALYGAAELNYYVRHADEEGAGKMFCAFMEEIMEYAKKWRKK
jgi:hypothetical protein